MDIFPHIFPFFFFHGSTANKKSKQFQRCRCRFYEVSEASIFRLTTHAPTVPARPVLVPGADVEPSETCQMKNGSQTKWAKRGFNVLKKSVNEDLLMMKVDSDSSGGSSSSSCCCCCSSCLPGRWRVSNGGGVFRAHLRKRSSEPIIMFFFDMNNDQNPFWLLIKMEISIRIPSMSWKDCSIMFYLFGGYHSYSAIEWWIITGSTLPGFCWRWLKSIIHDLGIPESQHNGMTPARVLNPAQIQRLY